MVVRHHVEGYEPFCDFMKSFSGDGQPVIILFSGSKLENGESWCDDCVRGKIFIYMIYVNLSAFQKYTMKLDSNVKFESKF